MKEDNRKRKGKLKLWPYFVNADFMWQKNAKYYVSSSKQRLWLLFLPFNSLLDFPSW